MRHTESRIQSICVSHFGYNYPQYRGLLFAVPNGGYRTATTAKIMKAEGVIPGVSDLLLLIPSRQYHGLCIEFKTDKGRQSEAQKEWQRAVEAQGYCYKVVRSLDEWIDLLAWYFYNSVRITQKEIVAQQHRVQLYRRHSTF